MRPGTVLALGELKGMSIAGRSDPEWRKARRASLHAAWDGASGVLGLGARSALATANTFSGINANPVPPQSTRDYRSVLTEVLRSRLNVDTLKVFPNFQPEYSGAMA